MGAARQKKMTKGDLLTALIILALAAALAAALFSRSSDAVQVRVEQDGKLVYSCIPDELKEPVYYLVEGEYPLTLEISPDGVRVCESKCPGGDCMHTGQISSAGERIVCLPNRLVVTLVGGEGGYDAVTG